MIDNSKSEGTGLADRDSALAHRLVEQEHAFLLDVRTPAEFNAGHIAGAVLLPVQELPQKMAELKKQVGDLKRPVVVYCRSGARSGRAKEMMLKAGFEKVSNLGPMSAW